VGLPLVIATTALLCVFYGLQRHKYKILSRQALNILSMWFCLFLISNMAEAVISVIVGDRVFVPVFGVNRFANSYSPV